MNDLIGPCVAELLTGEKRELNVDYIIMDGYGHPICLKTKSGQFYNWDNIISIRKE